MKTKMFLILIISGLSIAAINAQTHIEALIKKCETMENVDMEVIKRKNKEAKEKETVAVRIEIRDNRKLIDDFIDAFRKDESDADQITTRKRSNDELYVYQYGNMQYTLRIKEKTNAQVRVTSGRNYYVSMINSAPAMDSVVVQLKRIKWDSIVSAQRMAADSIIHISAQKIRSVNWDSIAKVFAIGMDSVATKFNFEWEPYYFDEFPDDKPLIINDKKSVIMLKGKPVSVQKE
ncbi:MAG: DUF5024 domain-containing protein [Tannerella sp.]|nr:DUF5024 domain-containing protein [Tannerella sp.]